MKNNNFESRFPHPLSKEDELKYLQKMIAGDNSAKEKLIMHNMRLVVHIAKKYYALNEYEDLVSVGYFGLVKGLESYKLDKNILLSTYLGRCIENEILMHLRKIKRHENCISLETTLSLNKDGDGLKLLDTLTDQSCTNFNTAINVVLDKNQISGLLKCLTELELKVITLRYGLVDGVIYSQKEIGEALGFSRSYISRLELTAIEKMKDELSYSEVFLKQN